VPRPPSCIMKVSIVPSGRKPTFLLQSNMSVVNREEIIAKVIQIAQRVGGNEGIEIVDVQFLGSGRGRLLRIFIDRPTGVSHGDCEFISEQVGTILDVEDVIPGDSYTLEVSSPGLERKLSKPKDFERFLGQRARVVLREPVENQRRWEGKLAGFSEGIVALEATAGKVIHFPLTQIEKANLKFDW
jgi:ribosome maturation factor RimP